MARGAASDIGPSRKALLGAISSASVNRPAARFFPASIPPSLPSFLPSNHLHSFRALHTSASLALSPPSPEPVARLTSSIQFRRLAPFCISVLGYLYAVSCAFLTVSVPYLLFRIFFLLTSRASYLPRLFPPSNHSRPPLASKTPPCQSYATTASLRTLHRYTLPPPTYRNLSGDVVVRPRSLHLRPT